MKIDFQRIFYYTIFKNFVNIKGRNCKLNMPLPNICGCVCDLQAGPRICLGKDFAYRQMKIMSTALLRFFRFKLADETKNVTYKTMFTLHISGGLHLSAVPRTGFKNAEM